jgi:hypothetical protein
LLKIHFRKTKKREEKQIEETAEKIAQDIEEEQPIAPKTTRTKTAAELAFEKAQKKRVIPHIKSLI